MKTLLAVWLLVCCFSANAQKQVVQLNLVKGKTYTNLSVTNTRSVQTINGQPLNIGLAITAKTSFTVTGLSDSLYYLQVRYDSVGMNMQLPGGSLDASSENGAADIFSRVFARLKGKPFLLTMTKTGKVRSVTGVDSLLTGLVNSMPGQPADQRSQALNQLLQSFGAKAMIGSIGMYTYIYPPFTVAKNDRWDINNQVEAAMPINTHTVYTLSDVTPASFIIDGISLVKTDQDSGAQLNGMPVSYNLAGSMTIHVKADKNTGWISSAEITQSLKGVTEIKDNPGLPGGMLIPVTLTSTISISNK